MNETTKKLLKRLPQKYHEVVLSLESEDGLIDGCRYLLYFKAPYDENNYFGSCVPVRNFKEAIEFVKEVF